MCLPKVLSSLLLCTENESDFEKQNAMNKIVALTLRFYFSRVHVFFLSRPRILEPDLCDALTQARYLGDPFQVLTVGVGVELEIRLQDLQLFLGERRAHAFRLVLVVALRVASVWVN